eukprot:272226-Pyramimonas_sp.AAC.1
MTPRATVDLPSQGGDISLTDPGRAAPVGTADCHESPQRRRRCNFRDARAQHPFRPQPLHMFKSLEDLKEANPRDLISGKNVHVPVVDWLVAGPPRQSKSKLNPNRGKNKNCIRN